MSKLVPQSYAARLPLRARNEHKGAAKAIAKASTCKDVFDDATRSETVLCGGSSICFVATGREYLETRCKACIVRSWAEEMRDEYEKVWCVTSESTALAGHLHLVGVRNRVVGPGIQ